MHPSFASTNEDSHTHVCMYICMFSLNVDKQCVVVSTALSLSMKNVGGCLKFARDGNVLVMYGPHGFEDLFYVRLHIYCFPSTYFFKL